MNTAWTQANDWFLHCAIGGGLLLLVAWLAAKSARQPVRQQRLGESGLAAALLLTVLAVAPSWLRIPMFVFDSQPAISSPSQSAGMQTSGTLAASATASHPKENNSYSPSPSLNGESLVLATRPPAINPEITDVSPGAMSAFQGVGRNASHQDALPEKRSTDSAAHPPQASAASVGSWVSWRQLVFGLYLLGASILLLRWLGGYVALRRLLRAAEPASLPVAAIFSEFATGARAPRLLISQQIQTPLSCGLWRPTIVLPLALAQPNNERVLRWVFAHELAHLQRRDALGCLLFNLGQVLYFYVPWFWWLQRRVRLCQEYIADAAAAANAPVDEYAQFLLSFTKAPLVPLGTTAVSGDSSDLFRRVKMMLQNPLRIDNRCPRLWSLAVAGSLLGLGVLISGVSLKASEPPKGKADDPPAKTEAKKSDDKPADEKKSEKKDTEKPAPLPRVGGIEVQPFPNVQFVPQEFNDEAMKEARRAMQRAQEVMRRQMRQNGFQAVPGFRPFGSQEPGRLGIMVEKPGATLIEQLDLPKGVGLTVEEVQANSAAAKAGIKAHDILLEFAGKEVPDDTDAFIKTLDGVKANTPVDAVVLRKGKRETVKGVSLPEVKKEDAAAGAGGLGGFPEAFQGLRVPNPPIGINAPAFGGLGAGAHTVSTSLHRSDDRFTGRMQDGSLIITVTGKVDDGKAKVSEIHVQDGTENKDYQSLDKVPERYRDKAKDLTDMAEKGSVKIELKK